jgi:hypothetical protein
MPSAYIDNDDGNDDPLARFVFLELTEYYHEAGTRAEKLQTAREVIQSAIDDLTASLNALQ